MLTGRNFLSIRPKGAENEIKDFTAVKRNDILELNRFLSTKESDLSIQTQS